MLLPSLDRNKDHLVFQVQEQAMKENLPRVLCRKICIHNKCIQKSFEDENPYSRIEN